MPYSGMENLTLALTILPDLGSRSKPFGLCALARRVRQIGARHGTDVKSPSRVKTLNQEAAATGFSRDRWVQTNTR